MAAVSAESLAALQLAAERIAAYHRKQKTQTWLSTEEEDILLGQMVRPLDRVGIYVPGGKAAYPSSVLMNAVPAKVAGVGEVIMVVPMPGGEVNPHVLAAARLAGVDRIFKVGGAQAVAALAYGTESVPRVDKITGPGNIYVATAKKQVFGRVDIDMIAGPSEILVINDGSGEAAHIAADLLGQAEHDELASSVLVTTSEDDGRRRCGSRLKCSWRSCRGRRSPGNRSILTGRSFSPAIWMKRSPSPTASPPSIWSWRWPIPSPFCRESGMPGRFSWGITRPKRPAIIWPGRTIPCRPAAPPVSSRPCRWTISSRNRASSPSPPLASSASAGRSSTSPNWKGCSAHARSVSIRLKSDK